MLDERGEDYGRRFTTRRPPYLLTGLVRCAKCQRNFVGAAGTGKRHRYRYYLCWTRSRYGPTACDADRLRADELEEAVLAALVDVYGKPEVIQEAIAAVATDGEQSAARAEQEVAGLDAELRRTEAAIERYMLAFENGKLTEDMFAERVQELAPQASALRSSQARGSRVHPCHGPRHKDPIETGVGGRSHRASLDRQLGARRRPQDGHASLRARTRRREPSAHPLHVPRHRRPPGPPTRARPGGRPRGGCSYNETQGWT
ncbi:MAG: recombinase zinc beta ribbon domain-containing protein [Acidimicrobiales bacterium]